MVSFDLWGESFIFGMVYSVIIMVPCLIVLFIGRKMIDRLGRYPSKTPTIQMSILFPLVILEVVTFAALIGFFRVFSS